MKQIVRMKQNEVNNPNKQERNKYVVFKMV